jgi:hypothetical protein
MSSEAQEAARPLRRLARLVVGRNELRRSSDRIEAMVIVVLGAALLAAVIAASCVGVHSYRTERAVAADLHPVVAVLSQSGPADGLTGYGQARARWRAPDGHWRSGLLTSWAAPGIWGAAAGSHIRVWVTRAGDLGIPPSDLQTMIFYAVLYAAGVIMAAGIVLFLGYWLCRRVLDRRRFSAWESEWAWTGPRWTSRR